MQLRSLLVGSAMLALLAGCAAGPTDQPGTAAAESAQVSYQGALPCRNCDGIELDVTMMGEEYGALEERTFTLQADYQPPRIASR